MKFINLVAGFIAFLYWKLIGTEGSMGAFTYGQVTSITHDAIKEMTEGIFSGNRTMSRLREKQELEEGGNKILCPLMTADDTNSTGEFYTPRDTLSLDEYDGISASEHEWRYLQESIVIYKPDIAKNAGNLGVLKLIDKKVRQGELAFLQRAIKGALSDGGASTGALDTDQFDGLQAVIQSSGTYGAISSTDLATWISTVDDNSGVNRALTQAILDKNFDSANEEGRGGPSMGLMDKNVFTKFKGLLTGIQRTTRESTLGGLGHKGTVIVYNGIDYLVENQMPANTLFHVDEDHFKLHVHKDHNMRRQSIQDLETADALLERIFMYANVVASERKFHSRINDITV
jgi:hypothetical protein